MAHEGVLPGPSSSGKEAGDREPLGCNEPLLNTYCMPGGMLGTDDVIEQKDLASVPAEFTVRNRH